MPKSVVVRKNGGPEVLRVEDVPVRGQLPPEYLRIRQTAFGINYTDVYYRNGTYGIYKRGSSTQIMPFIPGIEACGVIEEVGSAVQGLERGARVAYATTQSGAYTEQRIIHANFVVPVPDEIPDQLAVASLAKGMTAHYLVHRCYRIQTDDVVLIHDIASGNGRFLCQMARNMGAKIIGTVKTAAEKQIAKEYGCDWPLHFIEDDFVTACRQATKGYGAAVVYDSFGSATYERSIQSLRPMGTFISFGQSTGVIPPIDILSLAPRGVYVTRPTLQLYKSNRMELVLSAAEVFQRIIKGKVRVAIDKVYPMSQIVQAHQDLESGALAVGVVQL